MDETESRIEPVVIAPPGVDEDYLIEPAYAKSRGWGLYYFDDTLSREQLRTVVSDSSLASGVYMKYTSVNINKIRKINKNFKDFGQVIVETHLTKYCFFDRPNNFLITVIERDVSIVATDRRIMQEIFGASDTSRAEWIEEAERLRPDLRAEILAKYVSVS